MPRGPLAIFGAIHRRIDHVLVLFTRQYERLLTFALKRRAVILGAVAVLFAGSLLLLFGIGQEFFPQTDTGQLTIFVRCPSGTNIEETEHRISAVEQFLMRDDVIPKAEREQIISEMGLVPDGSAAYTETSGSQDAIIKVQLTDDQHQVRPAVRHRPARQADWRKGLRRPEFPHSTPAAWSGRR